jgi:hypothetical protein
VKLWAGSGVLLMLPRTFSLPLSTRAANDDWDECFKASATCDGDGTALR